MKNSFITAAAALFVFAAAPAWPLTDHELLVKVDSLASYLGSDFSAEYTFVQDKPGQSRSVTQAAVFRRDSADTYVIVVKEPAASRGEGYLKQGKTLYLYDPESKRFESTSNQARFQNTASRGSDFTRSTLAEDYTITSGEDVVLGKFKCRLLTLESSLAGITYPIMKVWISEDALVRKVEDYSLSGQKLRTQLVAGYYEIAGRFVPKAMLLVDELRGASIDGEFVNEKTQITINKPSFEKIADSVFSKTFLESVNR